MLTKSYIAKELKRLKELPKQLPEEIGNLFDAQALKTFINLTSADPIERPYTPLIKQLNKSGARIPISAPLLPGEKEFIISTARLIEKYYGPPVTDYSKVTADKWVAVDAWINFIKTMGPQVTPKAAVRRFENTMKFLNYKHHFDVDWEVMQSAVDHVIDMMTKGNKIVPINESAIDGGDNFFQKSKSNVGWPFYRNERGMVKGSNMNYKEFTLKLSKEWMGKYGPVWIPMIPSTIIGRDQTGGLNIDLKDFKSVSQLKRELQRKDIIKPSKARVVWATARVVNNVAAPFVKPLTEYVKDNSMLFIGYLPVNDRKWYMINTFYASKKHNLFYCNLDYSSFDLTVPAELIVILLYIIKRIMTLTSDQELTLDYIIAHFINTPFIVKDPNSGALLSFEKDNSVPSGNQFTNWGGSVIDAVESTYAKMKMYSVKEVIKIDNELVKAGAYPMAVMGDDLSTWLKSHKDVPKFAKIIKDSFNMDVSWDGTKTAYGVFFLQERIHDGKLIFPSPRAISKCLWVERPKGLNWTLWDLGFASKLENMKQNPELREVTTMLMSLDKTLLGLYSPDGVRLNPQSFSKWTAELAKEEVHKDANSALNPAEALYDGDPGKIGRFNADGSPSSAFLSWYFDLLNVAFKDNQSLSYYIRTFSTQDVPILSDILKLGGQ